MESQFDQVYRKPFFAIPSSSDNHVQMTSMLRTNVNKQKFIETSQLGKFLSGITFDRASRGELIYYFPSEL